MSVQSYWSDSGSTLASRHWRSCRKYDLNRICVLYVPGLGHGGPAVVGNSHLEGTYSKMHPDAKLAGGKQTLRRAICPSI